MDPIAHVPTGQVDPLAVFGLRVQPRTFALYSATEISEGKRLYDALADRAAEKNWSIHFTLGLYTSCCDAIRGRNDPEFVKRVAPLIAVDRLSTEEVVKRAEQIYSWLTADRVGFAGVKEGGDHVRQ